MDNGDFEIILFSYSYTSCTWVCPQFTANKLKYYCYFDLCLEGTFKVNIIHNFRSIKWIFKNAVIVNFYRNHNVAVSTM